MQGSGVTQEFFVKPGCDIQKGDPEYVTLARLSREQLQQRWTTPGGQYILNTWRANRFDRKVLDELVGKFYGQTDLRGASLSREAMDGADLSKVDLFGANLQGSKLSYAILTDSYLSEVNLKGTCFDWANMRDVLIDNASFDGRTSFVGVKLSDINFTLAEQLKDFAFGQQRIANLKNKYPRVALFLWITCDYGRSFPRFLLWCGGVILGFALAYSIIPGALSQSGFWNSLYFSAMTFATQGCDVQAASVVGKLLAASEVALGFLMTGLLVAILVKKTIGD